MLRNCFRLVVLLFLLCPTLLQAQSTYWTELSATTIQPYTNAKKDRLPARYRVIKLNRAMAAAVQQRAPLEQGNSLNLTSAAAFDIPVPGGGSINGLLTEAPVLSSALQQQYPHLRTYRLTQAVSKNQLGRITVSPDGVTGLLFSEKGAVYIYPLGKAYPDVHLVYYLADAQAIPSVVCGVRDELAGMRPASPMAGDCQLRTYRLAIAATGEYTTWAGDQAQAVTYITATVNNVTAIYERDITVRFTLVTNNNILFTDAATDPYATTASPNTTTLNTNHSQLNSLVGAGNYDLGMVFNDGWDGGLAALGSVCNASNKGRAASGLSFGTGANPDDGPQGPVFDGTVAHEIAHQFNATHSFIASNGACGSNATLSSSYEPGGGSTIMAYTNVCAPNYYQAGSDLYFHSGNIAQMQSFIGSGSASCAVTTGIANNAPVVTALGSSYTIPVSTPFTLTATGSDADGNTLYYNWEQLDAGLALSSTAPASTNTSGPNFRSYPPALSPSRTFPGIADIVAGISPPYEVLPSVTRAMNFRITARDDAAGGGCTAEDNVTVSTDATAGPFLVTSQAAPVSLSADGTNSFTVSWDVANTDIAPVNCTAVDILFSVDGGFTYPYTLVSNTANDGSEVIIVPNLPTEIGRVKVQARNNIFFNINSAYITITSACSADAASFESAANVSAAAGSATLDLNLSPAYGNPVSLTGTVTSSDPVSNLAVNNITAGACIQFGNPYQYNQFVFTPSVSGTYTFTRNVGTSNLLIFNLYNGSFNPANPCMNFMNSSGTYNSGVTPSASFSATLQRGLTYTFTVGTFSNGSPALPSAYSYSVTPPPGGGLFDGIPAPGAGFNYTYVIVNNATGNITAIDPSADLSNSSNFPGGTEYTVYGLSYDNSIPIGTFNSYIGGNFNLLYNDLLFSPGTRCGNLSRNSIQVAVLAVTPVSFLPLTATKQGDRQVLLTWKTASEQHNDHFTIERSSDGVNFTDVLGSVPGNGNSNMLRSYSFTDKEPLAGWNFYRIRQVDFDGRSSYSNIAPLQLNGAGSLLRVYPNPARNQVLVEFSSQSAQAVQISLIDNKGATVKQVTLRAGQGLNRQWIDLTGLSQGIYLLKTVVGSNTLVQRVLKQ